MVNASTAEPVTFARRVAHRTHGQRHGPLTRLMSPGDLGELVKPFMFLDHFESPRPQGPGFPAHPHSGLATHTTLLAGTVDYGDSTGKSGAMHGGDVEWMQAAGGVWHWGTPRSGGPVRGYQLWIALPAALEHAPAESHYIDASQIASDGRVRVLLGSHGALTSPIPYREPLCYLHVKLADGERWTYQPALDHDVAWLALHRGALRSAAATFADELVVFEPGNAAITVQAIGDTELVIGSARKHPHPLVCGSYSVHTSRAALIRGEQGIDEIATLPLVRAARQRTSR
jgi:redox-sensitive bicupin YhaK (pirin superfamily)